MLRKIPGIGKRRCPVRAKCCPAQSFRDHKPKIDLCPGRDLKTCRQIRTRWVDRWMLARHLSQKEAIHDFGLNEIFCFRFSSLTRQAVAFVESLIIHKLNSCPSLPPRFVTKES